MSLMFHQSDCLYMVLCFNCVLILIVWNNVTDYLETLHCLWIYLVFEKVSTFQTLIVLYVAVRMVISLSIPVGQTTVSCLFTAS